MPDPSRHARSLPAGAPGGCGPRFGTILRLLQAGSGVGGFIGPTLTGLIVGLSGSYRAAFLTAGAAVLLSGLAAWYARPPRSRTHPRALPEPAPSRSPG